MQTKKSSLEGLSSDAQGGNSESSLKQAKRWLDSKWSDWESFFAPYIRAVLQKAQCQGEVVLIIDGSETAGDCVTLLISFVWSNHALPLAWITRKGKKATLLNNSIWI